MDESILSIPLPDPNMSAPLRVVTIMEWVLRYMEDHSELTKEESKTAAHMLYELLLSE